MAVKFTPVEPGLPDSYWVATQDELKSVRRRGDLLIVAGALRAARDDGGIARQRLMISEVMLIGARWCSRSSSAWSWFVTSRKRRIAETRGLVCSSCRYLPHDTEIDDVASTRHCPRCAAEL